MTITRRMLDQTDWSRTPLGPRESWPHSLSIAVSICLDSRFPMFVWWGPELIGLYNDAYIPVLGKRHPAAFGAPAPAVWAEIWDVVGPQAEAVMTRGEATWNDSQPLQMERNGYPEETYFTWSYSPIHDEAGAIRGLFCACTEETARVMAERERDALLREALDTAESLSTWFDHAPGFVALLRGPDMVFEMVNEAYYQLIGHRPLIGRKVFEALPDARNQGFEELLRKVYDQGEPFVGRALPVSLQRVPGGPVSERVLDLSYQPVRDKSGTVAGIFVQGSDVTDQVRAAEALKEADRRKDEFLATLAHELRNPLSPIRNGLQLLKLQLPEVPSIVRTRQMMERQVSHLVRLVDDLMEVSRIGQGKIELQRRRLDLGEVIATAVEATASQAAERRIELHKDISAGVLVDGDPDRLMQVFSNLLTNAVKFTEAEGSIWLTLRQRPDLAEVTVRDTGCGIAPDSLKSVFEMFTQGKKHARIGGLGIGLALVRQLVELHGGSVSAASEGVGQGSEFTVRLPLDSSAMPLVDQPGRAARVVAAPRRRGLVIDDNADAADSLAAALAVEGHEVRTAYDGLSGLDTLMASPSDVVVVDIGMPGIDGYEFARRVRGAAVHPMPHLIALTGWGQHRDKSRALEAGFDRHMTKPADLDALLELLEAD